MHTPALAIPLVVVDIIRAERTARRNLGQDGFRQSSLSRLHLSGPPTDPAAALPHRRQQMRPGPKFQRGENVAVGQMVLEDFAFIRRQRPFQRTVEITDEVTLTIPCYSITEDQIMHPPAHINRIDLNETVMRQRSADFRYAIVEQY